MTTRSRKPVSFVNLRVTAVLSQTAEEVQFVLLLSDKKKVLMHHPDKRRAKGKQVKEGEDDYFTCITRGETVSDEGVRCV